MALYGIARQRRKAFIVAYVIMTSIRQPMRDEIHTQQDQWPAGIGWGPWKKTQRSLNSRISATLVFWLDINYVL